MSLKHIIDNLTLEELKATISKYTKEELNEAFLETDSIEKNMLLVDMGVEIDDSMYHFFGHMLISQSLVEANERFFKQGYKENIYFIMSLFQNNLSEETSEKYYHFLEKKGIHKYPQDLFEELVLEAPLSYIENFLKHYDVSKLNLNKLTAFDPKKTSHHFNLSRYYNYLSSSIEKYGMESLDLMLKNGLKLKSNDSLLIESALLKEDFSVIEKLLSLGVKMPNTRKLENIMNFLIIQGKNESIEYLLKNKLVDFSKAKLTHGTNIYLYNFLKGFKTGWNKNALQTFKLFTKYGLAVKLSQKYILDSLSNSKIENQELIDYLLNLGFNEMGKKFNHSSNIGKYISEKINILNEKSHMDNIFNQTNSIKNKIKI